MPTIPAEVRHGESIEPLMTAWLTASGLFRRVMEPYFATFGISGAQWAVLHTLHKAEQSGSGEVRMADLGDRLLVRPPSVTTVVQRNVRMGYVIGRPSAIDQRAKCVELTPAGRALIGRVMARRDEQMQRLFGSLAEDEQRQLAGLLRKFGHHLSELVDAND